MAIPPWHAGPLQRPQHRAVVAAEVFADPGQRPTRGVEGDRRLQQIRTQPLPPRRDAGPPQMLSHCLAADPSALRYDAHVVAGLVLLEDLLSLSGGQSALPLPKRSPKEWVLAEPSPQARRAPPA